MSAYAKYRADDQVLRQKELPMKMRMQIDPGICKFNTVVTAESEDSQHVTFEVVSECETIKEFAKQLGAISPVDAIATVGPDENPILIKARKLLQTKGCCDACVVPAGAVKFAEPSSSIRTTPKTALAT